MNREKNEITKNHDTSKGCLNKNGFIKLTTKEERHLVIRSIIYSVPFIIYLHLIHPEFFTYLQTQVLKIMDISFLVSWSLAEAIVLYGVPYIVCNLVTEPFYMLKRYDGQCIPVLRRNIFKLLMISLLIPLLIELSLYLMLPPVTMLLFIALAVPIATNLPRLLFDVRDAEEKMLAE